MRLARFHLWENIFSSSSVSAHFTFTCERLLKVPLRYIDELEGKWMDVTDKTSRVIRAEVEMNVGVHKSNENEEKKSSKKKYWKLEIKHNK